MPLTPHTTATAVTQCFHRSRPVWPTEIVLDESQQLLRPFLPGAHERTAVRGLGHRLPACPTLPHGFGRGGVQSPIIGPRDGVALMFAALRSVEFKDRYRMQTCRTALPFSAIAVVGVQSPNGCIVAVSGRRRDSRLERQRGAPD